MSAPAHNELPPWRRKALYALASVALGAAYWAIFSRAFLNYDTLYSLIWGRDLAHGRLPDYQGTLAPTPHPLAELAGALASLFGTDGGYAVMLGLGMVAFGALLVGIFLLGRKCFAWPVGLLAAVVVGISVPFLSYGMRAYVDIPFLALVVFAALLEARNDPLSPERPAVRARARSEGRSGGGALVLVLLALAGLLRPEAWLLSIVYLIYVWPQTERSRQPLRIALVLSAPIIWLASDLAITGELFYSLTATRDTAEALGRPRGILKVPEILPRRLGEIVRIVPLAGGAIGFVLGLIYLRRRSLLPATLAVLGGLGFIALGIAGLSLLGRYLFMPAAMVAIFFGVAAFGWFDLPTGKVRRNWAIFGIVLAVVFVSSSIAHQTPRLNDLRDGIQYRGAVEEDLQRITEQPAAKRTFARCLTIYVPNHRPVPILAWYLDRPTKDFLSSALVVPGAGAWVLPRTARVRDKFVLDRNDPGEIEVPLKAPRGWQEVTANQSWALYQRGC